MNFVLVDDSVSSRIARVIQGRSDAAHDSAKKSKSALHDRRWSGRKRSDSPGLIGHNKSTNALSCVVRDTSSTGAKVELVQGRNGSVCDPADVPEIPVNHPEPRGK